jgi:putative tricarboxylic transport membrane protein
MRRIDVYVVGPYVVALVVSAFFYYETREIAPAAEGQLGADMWPKTILLLAIATCLWEIARNVLGRSPRTVKHSADDMSLVPRQSAAEEVSGITGVTPWIGIGLTAAYVAAFPWIGYPLATFLYVVAFVYCGSYRKPLRAVLIGIAASLGFMFLFMRVVYVSLPIGIEPFAQVSTALMHLMGIK